MTEKKYNRAIGFPAIKAEEVGKVSLLNGDREMLNSSQEARADTPLPQDERQGGRVTEYWSASVPALYSCRKSLAAGSIVLKLLNNYRMWAKRRRAVEIQIHVMHGFNLEHIDRFLTKIGFRLSGNNYSMEI